jgi:hypothetical protein
LVDLYLRARQGFQEADPGHGHTHQIPSLFGGSLRIIAVDPRTLISDVAHLKKIFVEPRI